MTPNEMLQLLSQLWVACLDYPEAEHYWILKHIEGLQKLIFRLEKGEGRG
jgi:hypothetical protein